jgi:Zn-finger nucleic acid-binding protein
VTNAAVGMPCPVCKIPLVMSDRQGVEIDYCPQCRGVWLDRGELDKIIERSAQEASPAVAPMAPAAPQRGPAPYQQQPYYGDDDGRHRQHGYRGKKRKSFFEELFD